jgi:hypothetical protein
MRPKTRSAARVNGALIVEQPENGRTPRMNSSSVNENVGVVHEEEVSINQIFGKMIENLQTMTERQRPHGENKALDAFSSSNLL